MLKHSVWLPIAFNLNTQSFILISNIQRGSCILLSVDLEIKIFKHLEPMQKD